ncbi:hypothetical protein [Spirosoma lituiforme]
MKVITVTNGQRNEVVVNADAPPSLVTVGSSAYAGVLPELVLPIIRTGQTVFNIGGLEPRRTLYLNGVRQRIDSDYTITLPYLIWIPAIPLEPTDLLILSF